MSIFGDLETPAAKRSEPPSKQIVELAIKPHTTWQPDKRSSVIPLIQCVLDVTTSTVSFHAEAKTAFSDGTAGEGVKVSFFLNGNRLRDVETDDFGLAVFKEAVPATLFTMNQQTDELTARVRGFAKEASVKVQVHHKTLHLTVSHRWEKIDHRPKTGPYPDHCDWRYECLNLEIAGVGHPQGLFSVGGLPLRIQRCVNHTDWETIATAKLDSGSRCVVSLPDYYWDDQERASNQQRGLVNPRNFAHSFFKTDASGGFSGALKVAPDGWRPPDALALQACQVYKTEGRQSTNYTQ